MTNQIPGWSKASSNLRQLPAESIEAPLLICSEFGTFFLHRIKQLSSASKLEQIDLVDAKGTIPLQCVLYTEKHIGSSRKDQSALGELKPLHLDTSKHAPIPNGECSRKSIAAGIVGKFITKLYFPPLRRRFIDVLHWLYVLGTSRSIPKLKSDKVSAALIHELIFNSSWMANDEALCQYVLVLDTKTKGDKCLRPVQEALIEQDFRKYIARKQFNALELNSYKFGHIPKGHKFLATQWHCDDDIFIPFERLPEAAIRIFLWAFFESLNSKLANDEEKTATFEPLGNPSNWLFPEQLPVSSVAELPISDLLSWYAYGLCPKGGWKQSVLKKFDRFEFLGASWASLVDGLTNALNVKVKSYLSSPAKPKVTTNVSKKPKKNPRPIKILEVEKLFADMRYRKASQKEIAFANGCTVSYVSKILRSYDRKAEILGFNSRSVRSRSKLSDNIGKLDKELKKAQGDM